MFGGLLVAPAECRRYNTHEMKLDGTGILINLAPLGERDALATIFTREYGVMRGVMRAAQIARKNKPLVGQVGGMSWNARLDSQLGAFHWEAARNLSAPLMLNARSLSLMNAAFALVGALLPERVAFGGLYDATLDVLTGLARGGDVDAVYLDWEIALLRDAGYALDLSRCSGCGCVTELNYLSPRTGRAVCETCAAPYISKLYRLPLTLETTLKFIGGACAQQGADVPPARIFVLRK